MPSTKEETIITQVETCVMQTMAINLIGTTISQETVKATTKTHPYATDALSMVTMLENVETSGGVSTAKAMTTQLLTVPRSRKSMV